MTNSKSEAQVETWKYMSLCFSSLGVDPTFGTVLDVFVIFLKQSLLK